MILMPSKKQVDGNADVIFLTGQSNMAGYLTAASQTDAAKRAVVPRARIYAPLVTTLYNSGFVPLQFGVSGMTDPALKSGADAAFGQQWVSERTGRMLYIIKYAQGAKHVANDTLADSFYPDGGTQFSNLKTVIAAAMAQLAGWGITAKIACGADWQGESDANNEARANAYGGNKALQFSTLREWMYDEGYASTPHTPVVLTKIYTENGYSYLDEVRAGADEAAALLGNCVVVDAQDNVEGHLQADNIHADATGVWAHGAALATAAIGLL